MAGLEHIRRVAPRDFLASRHNARKDRPITLAARHLAAPLGVLALCGCHRALHASPTAAATREISSRPSESLYREPPSIVGSTLEGDGRVRLDGRADPGARVRLASPDGEATFAETDDRGAWRLRLRAPSRPRLFGMSMTENGRGLQSEGYVLVTPRGAAAQLRAGAGAVVIPFRSPSSRGGGRAELAILALDFDAKGGAVISGEATAQAGVEVWVDGVGRAKGSAGGDGRFSMPLHGPLTPGAHRLSVGDGARTVEVRADVAAIAPLGQGPFRATASPPGWRIDWLTPGGGLQTTLIINQPRAIS